jgi:hypothetical protein
MRHATGQPVAYAWQNPTLPGFDLYRTRNQLVKRIDINEADESMSSACACGCAIGEPLGIGRDIADVFE